MDKLVIIGDAAGAEIMYAVIENDPRIEVSAFSVHNAFLKKPQMFGKQIVSFEDLPKLFPPAEFKLINAIGYSNINKNRESLFLQAKALGYDFYTYIHPSATILSKEIGEGTFVMAGVVIEPFTKIRANTVIWSNSVVAHHAIIDENCWVASGVIISGEARIKKNCFIGVNSTVVNKVVVEEYNILGAQTLITKNTAPSSVYISRSGEPHRFSSEDYAKHILG